MLSQSVMSDSLLPFGLEPNRLFGPWDFPGQEYWGGLPCTLPGDLSDLGIEPASPVSPALQANCLPPEPLQVTSLPPEPKGSHVYIYTFFFRFFSIIRYYKILKIVP